MQGIHPDIFTHHIYIQEYVRTIRQAQRRINSLLRYIVKTKLQKLLKLDFLYLISGSQCVFHFVVLPQKMETENMCRLLGN